MPAGRLRKPPWPLATCGAMPVRGGSPLAIGSRHAGIGAVDTGVAVTIGAEAEGFGDDELLEAASGLEQGTAANTATSADAIRPGRLGRLIALRSSCRAGNLPILAVQRRALVGCYGRGAAVGYPGGPHGQGCSFGRHCRIRTRTK